MLSDSRLSWPTIETIAASWPGAIKIGPFGSQLKKEELIPAGYKVYGQENVISGDFSVGDRYVGPAKFGQLQSCQLYPGDVVLSMMGTVGHCAIFPEDAQVGIMDSHLLRIQVNRELVSPEFLTKAIQAVNIVGRQISRMSHGSIMSGLSSRIVKNLRIPLPPLPEQRRIAQILDTADEAIRQTERLIAKLKAVKAGLLHDLLTSGLDEHGRLRDPVAHPEQFKDSPLGRIPWEWGVSRVHEICALGRGRVISQTDLDENTGPYPVYSSQSKNEGVFGHLNTFDFEGDYVTWTTDGAYAGTVFYRSGRFNCTNVCGTLKASAQDLSMKYLALSLSPRTSKHVSYVGNPKLMNNVMAEIRVPLPSPCEQDAIVSVLKAHDARIHTEEAALVKLRQVKRGLMDDLLSGRVRVNH